MLVSQADNILLGNQEVQRVYLGKKLVWERTVYGLPPYGTSWNLYGVPPCEYYYLKPGIHLKGFSSTGEFMFTCAESPEKMDFTRIKSIHVKYSGIYGRTGVIGGIGTILSTRQNQPQSMISLVFSKRLFPESNSAVMDCRQIGGEFFLLLYSDLDYTLDITGLAFEYYPPKNVFDISSETWEQRNFQYQTQTVLTCNTEIKVPANALEIAVHLSANNGKALKNCVAFLNENKELISYGEGWQGTVLDSAPVSTHVQEIPENTAYVQISAGYAPDMTEIIQPSELKSCVLCFS
ncbi:MAG: hypothetical protein K2G88_08860 [Oscillospiraceae bacterium]|nr:hypothetical protein [Oscillospiraceae bacterium]